MNRTKRKFSTYKGFPLVRKGNTIYLGDMSDECVVMLQILQTKKIDGLDVASKISIYQISTDISLNAQEAVKRKCERESLYESLDLATIWLSQEANK